MTCWLSEHHGFLVGIGSNRYHVQQHVCDWLGIYKAANVLPYFARLTQGPSLELEVVAMTCWLSERHGCLAGIGSNRYHV